MRRHSGRLKLMLSSLPPRSDREYACRESDVPTNQGINDSQPGSIR